MRIILIIMIFLWGIVNAYAEGISATGTIKSISDVTMTSKASGTVGRILVKEGQDVKKGDIILEIENSRERAALSLAIAKLNSAKASLSEIEVVLNNSKRDLERKKIMKDVISKKEFENAEYLVMQHEALYTYRQSELAQAEAELKLREAELENTRVRAPLDGMVSWIYVKEGETIQALQTPLCDISSLQDLYVQVSLPISFIKGSNNINNVSIEVEGGSLTSNRFKGELIYVNPVLDAPSKTFRARVRIISPDRTVRPGMVASVFFSLK